jgi:hypothetical protein
LWKNEHKFPHVADRLGWEFFQETPLDKNPFIERVESHPLYQFQSFVQTPSFEPDKDLCLEEGETIYENKYVYEWVLFWRIMLLLSVLPLWVLLYESYNNNTTISPEYLSGLGLFVHPANSSWRGLPSRRYEKLLYWGEKMWPWQLGFRKCFVYFSIIGSAVLCKRLILVGDEYVIKAVFNRERDLVFLWRPTGFLKKELHVYELHFLEQTVPRAVTSWNDLGNFKKDGIFDVYDMRLDQTLVFYNDKKYWNIDQREYFFKNTTTMWNGLRNKDVNRGIWFNRSTVLTDEEFATTKKINSEINEAIEKHGPIAVTDYDYNYKYQIKKRVQDIKRNLIEGKPIDTSIYRENKSSNIYNDHHHDLNVKPAIH